MSWQQQKVWVEKNIPNVTITSTYRPGSRGSGGSLDYHSRGLAVDIAGSPAAMVKAFNIIAASFPNAAELIYSPMGSKQLWNGKPHLYTGAVVGQHYDHVHWAQTSGSIDGVPAGDGGGDGSTATNVGLLDNPLSPLTDLIGAITNPAFWLRVLYALGGAALVIFALVRLTGRGPTDLLK